MIVDSLFLQSPLLIAGRLRRAAANAVGGVRNALGRVLGRRGRAGGRPAVPAGRAAPAGSAGSTNS
jgi:hypothetical protein